uniref:Uncharacterized protein LOC111136314 isoform X1 n=1 Tax=Crassostrea virginica TaxID=6565 RepID=A0A8B8ESR2_CRAVI|nr:uncharacterized protein LOC111136314 isoform X1 [Crassostrea virginica]
MARLTEPRFATAGKFVPMKFREDSLPITESERLFKKCGSQFPPMTLEPLPYERDRVAERMSPEDRLRRKQWMEDQKIPKGEPRMEVMEKIKPTNAFRRFYQTPGKQLEGLFTSVTSPWNAKNWRLLCTRLFRGYIFGLGLVYWIKYNSMDFVRSILNGRRPSLRRKYFAEKTADSYRSRKRNKSMQWP